MAAGPRHDFHLDTVALFLLARFIEQRDIIADLYRRPHEESNYVPADYLPSAELMGYADSETRAADDFIDYFVFLYCKPGGLYYPRDYSIPYNWGTSLRQYRLLDERGHETLRRREILSRLDGLMIDISDDYRRWQSGTYWP